MPDNEGMVTEETVTEPVLDSTEGEEQIDSSPEQDASGTESEISAQSPRWKQGPDGKFISPKAEAQEGEPETADEAEAEPVVVVPSAPQGRAVPLKVDGQVFELPGAFQRDDGVIEVTADGFEHVHRWMGKGIVSDQKIAKLQQQLAEASERSSAEVEWAKAVGERYAEIAMLPEEEQLEYLRAFRAEFPSLRAQAEAEHWKREAQRAQRSLEPDPQQVQAQRQQQFAHSFDENFSALLQQPWAKGLTPDDQAQLHRELQTVADSFLWIADRDYPEQGFTRGEWVFNDTKMAQAIQARAEYVKGLRAAQARVTSAAQTNAVARTTKPVAPPVGAPKTVTQGTTGTPGSKVTSREDWQKRNLFL